MSRSTLLEQLADCIVDVERPHPVRVAIDGPPAAGKTHLAEALVAPLRARGRPVIRASVDGFHHPRARRYRRGADSATGYYYDAFDYEALRAALLLPLGPGGDRRYRRASFELAHDVPLDEASQTAPPAAVLLCDGLFLLRPALDDCWDWSIFLVADERTVVERAVRRDRELLGDEQTVRARYEARYLPAQRLYEGRCRPRERADVVIDNNDPLRPWLIKG